MNPVFPSYPSPASRFSSVVSTCVYRHGSVSTQTPVYATTMLCVSSSRSSSASFVAMCWVRLCPRLAQHAHVLFCSHFHCGARGRFALSFLHILRSYTSYRWPVNPLAFVQNTIYTRNLSMYLFPKTLVHTLLRFKFKPWFTQTPCFV